MQPSGWIWDKEPEPVLYPTDVEHLTDVTNTSKLLMQWKHNIRSMHVEIM